MYLAGVPSDHAKLPSLATSVKPIQMRWDERGRLWVACAASYPQIKPGEKANDYVLVCEDTDGDGRADTFTKFAEGLFMPTGIELGDGGLYVAQGTELLHLRDTDGDGKADVRRVIFSGFALKRARFTATIVPLKPPPTTATCCLPGRSGARTSRARVSPARTRGG